jgi:DNA repair protein RadA/Sms
MAKSDPIYVCQACDTEFPKWHGKCQNCGEWNALVEEQPDDGDDGGSSLSSGSDGASTSTGAESGYGSSGDDDVVRMGSIEGSETDRLSTEIGELDRVLGGGLVPGGVVLLGGDPGIGKSTLSLQMAGRLASGGLDILYITGEESLSQLKLRADRLEVDADDVWVVCETSLERTEDLVREREPDLLVVDSIQTLSTEQLRSSPGSVPQLKEVTSSLTHWAKGFQMPTILIGHVTKEGAIAGPKVLEHMVDTVLYFEGEQGVEQRVLRAVKNRYGSTDEIGVFTMRSSGLEEVANPSAMFLEEKPIGASGSAVIPIVEGTRPLLVEIQGLVSPTQYSAPSVTAVGVDRNRVTLMLNIIEKRTGLEVTGHDVFVNVAGGMHVEEPAADLAVASAILSSYLDRPVSDDSVLFGEIGLTGEIRAVSRAPARLLEADNMGFERAFLPRGNREALESHDAGGDGLPLEEDQLDFCRTLADLIREAFGDDVLS